MTIEELMRAAEGKKIKIYPNVECIKKIEKNADGSYTIHTEKYTEKFPDEYGYFSFCDANLHMEAKLIHAHEKTSISRRIDLLKKQNAEENRKRNQEKKQAKAKKKKIEQQELQEQQELLETIKQKLDELTEFQGTDSNGMPFINMIFDYPSCKIGEAIVFVRDADNEAFRPAVFTGFEKMGDSSFIWSFDGIDNARREKNSALVNLKQESCIPNLDLLISSYQRCYNEGYFSNGEYAEKFHNNTIDRNEIYNYLANERKVTSLMHFTKHSNLQSIFTHGILPIEMIRDLGIANCSDHDRYDGHLECSCFSLSFPNYSMLSAKRGSYDVNNPNYYAYAVLEIDIKALISSKIDNVYFLPINAATNIMTRRGIETFNHLADAKNMFCESINYKGNENLRRDLNIPEYYTTCPQAELMIAGWIEPKYIKRIDVNSCDEQQKLLQNEFVKNNSIEITLNELFDPRMDYKNWRTQGSN